MAAAARAFGAEIRTGAPVARIDVRAGTAAGVTLTSGEQIAASTVITTAHPKISFLDLVDRAELPPDFVDDIQTYRSRSGAVKVNLAVDRLPRFASHPQFDAQIYGGTIVLAESLDDVQDAFDDAARGLAARLPFADICIPSVFDPTLAPGGDDPDVTKRHHIVSMFTQWVPHSWHAQAHPAELEAYADRLVDRFEAVAPGFTSSIVGRQVIGPYQMEQEYGLYGGNIFHGELTPGQMFHCRPAAGYADLRTPIRGLYQAGSATHGGGGVTGLPGRNVVRQVVRDRRYLGRRRSGRR
jgi:phytoene dehydrogenase-like protein